MNEDLELICACRKVPWCSHRTEVLKGQLDSGMVPALLKYWNSFELPIFGANVKVPLSPSLGIFQPIRLDATIGGMLVATVPLPPDPDPTPATLGVLTNGDGLGVIRDLLSDTIGRDIISLAKECTHKKHGYRQEMALRRAVSERDHGAQYVTKWHIFMYGACDHCLGSLLSTPTGDFDDVLVEDSILPGARKSPWKTK